MTTQLGVERIPLLPQTEVPITDRKLDFQGDRIREVFTAMAQPDFDKLVGYTDAQYKALADLTQALHRLYQFPYVITHHFAARARKRDPGGYFDWDKFLGDANLAELRTTTSFKWDPGDDARAPKGFAERQHAGCWPA